MPGGCGFRYIEGMEIAGDEVLPEPLTCASQRDWCEPVYRSLAGSLFDGFDAVGKARFKDVGTAPSSSWIHALPSSNLRFQLGNDETSIAIDLRVGSPLVLMHQYACGS